MWTIQSVLEVLVGREKEDELGAGGWPNPKLEGAAVVGVGLLSAAASRLEPRQSCLYLEPGIYIYNFLNYVYFVLTTNLNYVKKT